jgi:hypothetical protein
MRLTRKTNITKRDIEVAGKSYEAVNQFIYLGSQINSKNLIQEEIRLRIQAGNRSLCANKKLLKTRISMLPVNYRHINLSYDLL